MLVGEQVSLLKFTNKFIIPEYISWLNDFEVNKYLCTGRFPVSKDDIIMQDNKRDFMFAIMDKEDFKYIGTISLHGVDWISRKGEVGYMIGDKKYWGKGIASDAVGLVIDYGFRRLNLNKIIAGVVDGNKGSVKVLEKNGFNRYAINPQEYWLNGEYLDNHMFVKFQIDHLRGQ